MYFENYWYFTLPLHNNLLFMFIIIPGHGGFETFTKLLQKK